MFSIQTSDDAWHSRTISQDRLCESRRTVPLNWLPTINEQCIHLTCCVLINFNQNQLIISVSNVPCAYIRLRQHISPINSMPVWVILRSTSFVLCIKRCSAKFDFLCDRTRFIKQTWNELLEWCPSRRNFQMVWWVEQSLDYCAHCWRIRSEN